VANARGAVTAAARYAPAPAAGAAAAPPAPPAAGSARDAALCDALLSALALEAAGQPVDRQPPQACAVITTSGQVSAGAAGGHRRDPGVAAVALCELAIACGRRTSDALLHRVQSLLQVGGGCGGVGGGGLASGDIGVEISRLVYVQIRAHT
jgi:hypothetical protein